IEEIGTVEPRDRIGIRFREDGLVEPDDFQEQETYVVDVELWDLGRRELRTRKLDQVSDYIEARAGEVLDRYTGPSITMLRVRCPGTVVRTLLTVEDIQSLDSPPEPDLQTAAALE